MIYSLIRLRLSSLAQAGPSGPLAGLVLLLCCLALPGGQAQAMGTAPLPYAVGVRSLSVNTPNNAQLGVVVWYPSGRSNQASYETRFGRWIMRAEKNAAPARLQAPVILISHDMVSSSLAMHELATCLAGSGFVVVAPTHTGDSVENASALYSAALLYYRPIQLHQALFAVSRDPAFKGMLDLQRIGLLGAGAGALTCMQLCGVDIDPSGYTAYCEAENDTALCSSLAVNRFARLNQDMREIRAKHGNNAFVAPLANVKAVGLLTPGWLCLARRQTMAGLRVPVAALFAAEERLYAPVRNGEDVLRHFPSPLYDSMNYQILEGVDHYSLASQCPPEMARQTPESCGAIRDEDREKLADIRNSYFSSFFLAALGMPTARQ